MSDEHDLDRLMEEAIEMDRQRTRRLYHLGWCKGFAGTRRCSECARANEYLSHLK